MKLDGRMLAHTDPSMTGSDVDRLHEELAQLGDIYRQLVQQDVDQEGRKQFGNSTQKAVTTFQQANRQRLQQVLATSLDGNEQIRWAGVWGSVDPATAQLINEDVARIATPFVIRGRVELEDGTPVEGVRVRAYDRDMGTERQELHADQDHITNAGGVFLDFQYRIDNYAAHEGAKGQSADLVFAVESVGQRELVDTTVELVAVYRQAAFAGLSEERRIQDLVLGFSASPRENVRLVVRYKGQNKPSEYERIMSSLSPIMGERMTPDQFNEEMNRDISFAARESGEDRALIKIISEAWTLSKVAGFAPELFYGLLRDEPPTTVQAMPADLDLLLPLGRAAWEAKLTEAFTLNLIPSALQAQLSNWLDQLQRKLVQATLRATDDSASDREQQACVADMLTYAGIDSQRHESFANLLVEHEGPSQQFWESVGGELTWPPADIQSAQSALELAEVVSSYKPLLAELFAGSGARTARALAREDRGNLQDLITRTGAPSGFPGAAAEQRDRFLQDIESKLRVLYPSEYLAKVLRQAEDPNIRRASNWLQGMLLQTIATPEGVPAFDLVNTPASRYLRENGDRLFANLDKSEAANLASQLKRVQRVHQLSSTAEQAAMLLKEDLHSAAQIARWSDEHFVKQYGERLGGAEAAAGVHAKASYIHATLLNLHIDTWKASPSGAPKIDLPPEMHTEGATVTIPSINELFGADDLCACESCLSVLSPAAYFVDLMQFHDLKIPGQTTTNLDVLLKCRPDLQHIQLTCENTNTRIPYVDLVNEILASYVAHGEPFAYNDPVAGVVSGTAEELRVNPISITDAATQAEDDAHEKLAKAIFPLTLPFNHWLEVGRLYLAHFRIKREVLMRRYAPDTELDTELAIAAETLGLSSQEFEVVTMSQFSGGASTIATGNVSLYGFVEIAPAGTAPTNHVTPEFAINDKRTESLKAVQNFLKNVSTSPGLTPAIRAAINIDGQLSADTSNALDAFRSDHGLVPGGGTNADFWGVLDAEGHRPLSVLMCHVPMFLRQSGLSYDDLVNLVTTRFVNPRFNDRVFFSDLGIFPEQLMELIQAGATAVPAALLPIIGAAGISERDFLAKVSSFSSEVVLDSPPDRLCDLDQTTIRHMDGTLLSESELVHLQQVIRLWRKLGWSLHEVDLGLTLFPITDSATLILRLADIKRLLDNLNIPVEQAAALWNNIDTWDDNSLFERLFRSKTAQSLDPIFKLDRFRREIDVFAKSPATPPLVGDHTPLLLAAFRISAADLSLLTKPTDSLNLQNISSMYRRVVLSKALGLSISDLLLLIELCGIDPMTRPMGEFESAAMAFVRIARSVKSSGLTLPQLNYILKCLRPLSSGDLLTVEQQKDAFGTLRASLQELQQQYLPADDPTGSRLTMQLGAALSPPQIADTLSKIIHGTALFAEVLPDFPTAVSFPPLVANKASYNADTKELRYRGVMTAAEQAVLQAASFVNTLPAQIRVPFTKAVDDLFEIPEAFAKEKLFDLNAEIILNSMRNQSSLQADGTVDLPAVATKVETALAQVRRFLSLSLIKRSLSDTFQLDGKAVTALLQDSSVLKALILPSSNAAAEDFLQWSGAGLQASYFNNATLTGTPAVDRVEPVVDLNGTVLPPAGVGAAPFSVRWSGYVYSPLSETFSFVVRSRDAIRVWLNKTLVVDEWKAQPLAEYVIETKLRRGSLNQLTIEHAYFSDELSVQLSWRSPSLPLTMVPTDSLYSGDALDRMLQPLVRIEKLASLVRTFELTASDIKGVSRLNYFDWNAIPVTAPTTSEAVTNFGRLKTLQRFVEVRNQVSRVDGSFVELLSSGMLDAALDLFSQLTSTSKNDAQIFADAATRHPFDPIALTYSEIPPEVKDLEWWSSLSESSKTLKTVGCSAAQILEWGLVKNVTRAAPAPPTVNWYAQTLATKAMELGRRQGEDLKRLVKAKYDEATWRLVARPLNDKVRILDRDALTSYVQNMPAILEEHYVSNDELFDFFLIDLKMEPCFETSRVQQGIATIQLHLQRGLMGLLKPDVLPSSIDRKLYERMQSYALWQPAREILIHPEKYIRWDLLDRKSAPYSDFERNIRKQDLTQVNSPDVPPGRWAEAAFMSYLEAVDEVSKLEICGQYHDEQNNVLHVFARTHNAPYRYFYRYATQYSGVGLYTQWTTWERVPLDIDSIQDSGKDDGLLHFPSDNNHSGAHLIPVIWNRRLYLFWPQFRLTADEAFNNGIPSEFDRVNQWEIKLAWSELWNGSWSPKQVSLSSVFSRPYVSQSPVEIGPNLTITRPTATQLYIHEVDETFWGTTITDTIQTEWHPGIVNNELVPADPGGDGGPSAYLEIKDPGDYAVFTTETTGYSVMTYLPLPESFFFYWTETGGKLAITPALRYSAYATGKQKTTTKLSLTVKQGDKLTFRDKTKDPVMTLISSAHQLLSEVGVFNFGSCKVRDVETLPINSSWSYSGFSTPGGSSNSFQGCKLGDPLKHYFAVDQPETKILNKIQGPFRVIGEQDLAGFKPRRSFFFQDRERVYLVTPFFESSLTGSISKAIKSVPASKGTIFKIAQKYSFSSEFQFQLHSHPQICEFIRRLNQDGLFALLATNTQQLQDTTPSYFETSYSPTTNVAKPYPDDGVDFSLNGAYSQYNWELFLYAPMRAWAELLRNYQFDEAERFLRSVADITADGIWQFRPFQVTAPVQIQEILGYLSYTGSDPIKLDSKAQAQESIQEWLRDPYNPHLIARRRVSAYMEAVMMDCCRHYLAAADFEFTKYTMESIVKALQYLVILLKLLDGKSSKSSPTAGMATPETFNTLKAKGHLTDYSDLSLATSDLETELPFTHSVPALPGTIGALSSIHSMYFCIPPDDEWATMSDTVADRLFKIRHCMNIEGIVQELPLFPEPIDPMLLVEARAQGLDISSIFDDFQTPLPHHEFSVMFEKALRMVDDVRAFAQRFETLVEKSEAEGLAEMRVEQEAQWLKDYLRRELVQTSQQQTALREAVEKTRAATQARFDFYNDQITIGLIEDEKAQRDDLVQANSLEIMAQAAEVQASLVSLVPEEHAQGQASGTSFGGSNMGAAFRAAGGVFHAFAGAYTHNAAIANLNSLWERRRDEWTYQRDMAALELKKIDSDLLAARIQENVASLRIENHDKTTANTQAVLDYYRNRFFTSESYSNAAEDLYPDFFQMFQQAYYLCRQTQACCRFQFGLPDLNIIQFGNWNNARRGMLAAEHLHLALRQLERVALDADKREYEIRRDVSLVMLDPQAFITLKQTGQCEFEIPETFFDGDYPGQYMRRLRGVSITIPCVVGRFASVNCVVTLLKNKTRITSEVGATGYEESLDQPDKRFITDFAASQSIVTSHAQNDSGTFDPEPRDGRYPPFRGAGSISYWRVEIPRETNAIDFNGISDVIFHLPYTSRPGGELLRTQAWKAREKALKDASGRPQRRFFQAKFGSRDNWHRFLHPDDTSTSQSFSLEFTSVSIGTLLRERTLSVSIVDVYLNFKRQSNNSVYQSGPAPLTVSLSHQVGGVATPAMAQSLNSLDGVLGGTPIASFPLSFDIEPGVTSTLVIEVPLSSINGIAPALLEMIPGTTHVRIKADEIDDLWFVVQYSVK